MAEFKGQEGIWRTSETGVHYFIPNGVNAKQAWDDWSKNRHYLQYWKIDEPENELSPRTGLRKKEYEKLISKGGIGDITDYIKDWYHNVPDDIEDRMKNALNDINEINNKKDFFEQLRNKLYGNGIHQSNYTVILDAFDNEIKEKYNKLIEPVLQRINSIDIDNAPDFFDNAIEKYSSNLTPEQKIKLKELYDNCEDEECKIMMSVVANEFETNYEMQSKKGTSSYGENHITLGTIQTNHLVHENFHSIFEHYDVKDTDLPKILKEEFNRKVVHQIEKDYGVKAYIENSNWTEEQKKRTLELLEKENQLRMQSDRAYREMKTADAGHYLEASRKYYDARREWKNVKFYTDSLNEDVKHKFYRNNANLADMIEATGIKLASGTNLGYGHGASYWRDMGDTIQADEFFAEMAEMKATDKEQYERVRKYIPKSVKRFEEIFKNIINNKGKVYEL